jgi:transcriptional regulator with PAS, ATPase and Fis domain
MAKRFAQTDDIILLTGPTGSGKDHLARYIHGHSNRSGRFITVNCSAIQDNMIESELFGHRRESFAGADMDKEGLLMMANHGTIFLNEIAASSQKFQIKILDFIDNKQVRPIGGTEVCQVDVRIIAASNRNLEQLLLFDEFRSDLYHRLNVLRIELSPLTGRKSDIRALAKYFLSQNGIEGTVNYDVVKDICSLLSKQKWPGNIRELKSTIRRACIECGRDPLRIYNYLQTRELDGKDLLIRVLKSANGNKSEAGRKLGLSEGAIRYQIKKYGLEEIEYI